MGIKRSTPAAQRIADALDANPKIANLTLAKQLFKKYPNSWISVEACRSAIRIQRGAYGESSRTKVKVVHSRTKEESEQCRTWGALLPEAQDSKWSWQTLPKDIKRWLVLSDIHIPFHDPVALKVALEYAHGECDGVLLNGDTLDCYALSRFEKDPELVDFDGELDGAERLLDSLDSWGAKKIVFKIGNHEARLEKYLINKAPELLSSRRIRPRLSIESFLDLDKRGIQCVRSMDPIQVGKLCVLHGHEMGGGFSSPVNPARGLYLKGKECALIGHEHRTSEHTEQSMRGVTVTTWSTGCLCNLRPAYRPFNKWNHGAAILDVSGKDWHVKNFRIVDGRVV